MRYNGEYNLNLIVFGIVTVVILLGAFIAARQKAGKIALVDLQERAPRRRYDKAEEKNEGYLRKVKKKIKQAGIQMPLYVYFGSAVVTGIIVYAVVYFLIDSAGIAAMCALVGYAVPSRIVEILRERRVREMENQFTKAHRRKSSPFRS